jgi:hypothetical protein
VSSLTQFITMTTPKEDDIVSRKKLERNGDWDKKHDIDEDTGEVVTVFQHANEHLVAIPYGNDKFKVVPQVFVNEKSSS